MSVLRLLVPAVVLAVFAVLRLADASPEESQLYVDLLKDHNPYERPVEHSSQNVTVNIGLILQQIVDVDEKNQEVEVNAWVKLTWYDYKLQWDPKKYAGITDVRFKKTQVWTPDLLLYNSVAEEFDSLYPANVLVYSNGFCTWIPPAIFKLSAKIHVAWFPFDSQVAELKFGSWTHDGSKLDLRLDENGFDLSTYIPNGEWEITSVNAERHIQFYKCCIEPYFDIIFSFRIRRKTLFYGFNLIVPCIAITLLTIIGFTYPAEAGEKMSIQINVLLSICIFQNYVSEMSPPTSESVAFLGTYFLFTILTVSLSVVGTVVIVNVHNRTTRTHYMTPGLVKIFLRYMPWAMMMKAPRIRYIPKDHSRDVPEELKEPHATLRALLAERQQSFDSIPVKRMAQLLLLEKMLDDVKLINQLDARDFEDDIDAGQWRYVAVVLDRLILYACALFITVSTFALFLSAIFG